MFGSNKQFKYDLGSVARDTVTGLQGTVTARYEFLNGCVRYMLESLKDGDVKENVFDEDRLALVSEDNVVAAPAVRTGGPRPTPSRTGSR